MTYQEIRELLAAFEADRVSGAGNYAVGAGAQNPAICRVDGEKGDPILVPLATFRALIKDLCEAVDTRDREMAELRAQLAGHRPSA